MPAVRPRELRRRPLSPIRARGDNARADRRVLGARRPRTGLHGPGTHRSVTGSLEGANR